MGKAKYRADLTALFNRSPVVSYDSIARLIQSHHKKTRSLYAKRLIHYLLRKGTIQRLTKGCYTARDDLSLAVFCFQPAYLGLQDALSMHGLWEQETIPVIITTRKIRQGIRHILGKNVLLRRMDRKYFFGVTHFPQDTVALPYSDIEKTFLDMLYFKEPLSTTVLAAFKKKINRKKLALYLRAYPRRFRMYTLSLLA